MAHKEYQRKKHFGPGRCYLHDEDGARGHAQGQGRWGTSLAAAFWARHAFPRPGLKDTRELPPHDGNCSVKERVVRFLLKKSLLAKHPRWIRSDFKRQMSSHSGHGKAASQEFQIVTLCEAGGTGWSPGEGAGHGGPRVLWAGRSHGSHGSHGSRTHGPIAARRRGRPLRGRSWARPRIVSHPPRSRPPVSVALSQSRNSRVTHSFRS